MSNDLNTSDLRIGCALCGAEIHNANRACDHAKLILELKASRDKYRYEVGYLTAILEDALELLPLTEETRLRDWLKHEVKKQAKESAPKAPTPKESET